jgi:transcriptional regulator with XRE-family HTH domain
MTVVENAPFAELLSRLRMAKGLTQEDLAERAGMSVRGVSDLERGLRRRPQAATLKGLCEALGLEGQQPGIDRGEVDPNRSHGARRPLPAGRVAVASERHGC